VKQPYRSLLRHAKQNGWDTVLDAAALLPTSPFNLSHHPEIDAIPISWYKILGRPDIGSLVVSHQFLQKMRKRHFAGGTVSFVANSTVDSFRLLDGPDAYMDGTVPYGVFPLLRLALDRLDKPQLRRDIAVRVECLLRWMMAELLALRWPTRDPLVRIIGFPYIGEWNHGSALSIVLYSADGIRLPFGAVFDRLERYGIDLRSGCMCNTVAAVANPGIAGRPTPPWIWQYSSADDDWQLVSTKEGTLDPGDEGVIRISLGAPSTFEDVWRVVECLRSLMQWPVGTEMGPVPRKKGGSLVDDAKRWWIRLQTPELLRGDKAG
jgi:molybdenum cofactor sulfurtransferase